MFLGACRAVAIGMGLGIANTIVVGCGIAPQLESWENNPAAKSAALPAGVLTGACLGLLAYLMRALPRWLVVPVLIQTAVLVVYVLAEHYAMLKFAAWSCVPTVIAALLLERWTREKVSEAVPAARARRR